jgi:hypothetical protein
MAKKARYAATNENLIKHSLEPAMRWLIAAALDRSTLTYGEVKARLEREASFSTIFATRIGLVAGELMYKIQDVEPDAPLINVLVVSQQDGRPSKGAGGFMAQRFGVPKLAEDGAKKRYPGLWERNFSRAADEVYAYGAQEWADLYERVFGRPLTRDGIEQERDKRKQGKEKDGVQTGRRYGPGGEGPLHKALRLWVCDNPQALSRRFAGALAETEFDLDSGDRVDVVYQCADRTIVIEVKSRISNAIDLRRGVFQCIKYRAVKCAMDVRPDPPVEAWLVTEEPVKGEIAALLKRHKIKHFLAPLDRK